MTTLSRFGSWALLLLLAACQAPAPVDRQAWQQAAARLLKPFLTKGQVGCGELLIEITPNFYANIGQPAVDTRLHGARKERGDGYDETIWTNRVGDYTGSFTVTIGGDDVFTEDGKYVRAPATQFTVLHQVRLRVYTGTGVPVRLDVVATGQPLLANDGGQPRDLAEWRVSDGVLFAR